MSEHEPPREADVRQVNWRLDESLKACRAMIDNYRLMLGAVANDNQAAGAPIDRMANEAKEAEEA